MKERIVILGAGESGVGAAMLAKDKGYEVFVADSGPISDGFKDDLESRYISYEENGHSMDKILNASEVIKSPGIPDNINVIRGIQENNIPIISEIEWAYRFTDARIIAITGTNGKTTTTLLAYHLLKYNGFNVGVAGNVGNSFARDVLENKFDYYVIEVSSFQLDGSDTFKPEVAVLLNITPDHLDRYDYKFENYVESKFRIIKNLTRRESFVYFLDGRSIKSYLEDKNLEPAQYQISVKEQVDSGAYLTGDEKIVFDIDGVKKIFDFAGLDNLYLRGKHNAINLMAAVIASLNLGLHIDDALDALESFKNAPHRLELISNLKGVEYINDSKATNLKAFEFALENFKKPVIWIAGGIDKGNDYNEVKPVVLDKVKALILLGINNHKIREAF
jgi:UDP-N-acetylmuramoylalanine--D-glutamate ligase